MIGFNSQVPLCNELCNTSQQMWSECMTKAYFPRMLFGSSVKQRQSFRNSNSQFVFSKSTFDAFDPSEGAVHFWHSLEAMKPFVSMKMWISQPWLMNPQVTSSQARMRKHITRWINNANHPGIANVPRKDVNGSLSLWMGLGVHAGKATNPCWLLVLRPWKSTSRCLPESWKPRRRNTPTAAQHALRTSWSASAESSRWSMLWGSWHWNGRRRENSPRKIERR